MPRVNTKYKKWDPDQMKLAINAVRSKEMGYLKASKLFAVPKTTLEDYVKQTDKTPDQLIAVPIGRKPILSPELEEDLVSYCLEMDRRFYGVGIRDIKRLAYQLAMRNGLRHPFSHESGAAGKKWLKGFFKRHPNLSIRKPQGISKARIKGFTPENVNKFFDLLEPEMEKINHNPARVFNVDESGITTVQSKNTRVISLKGKKQVGAVTAAERGSLMTVVFCMNAAGGFVPPLFVFPRKNMKAELLDGAPPGSIAACHPSGWIQQHIFTQWLQHFIQFVKPSRDDSVLLILDGHYSHTRNIDVIEMARTNYVTILCIPPHTSHKMQPLDLSFMSPFKTFYSQQIQMWLKQNPARIINSYQICKLMCPAYLKTCTAEISVNGFRKSGICPFNRNRFTEHDFVIERQRERTPPPAILPNNEELTPPRDVLTEQKQNEQTPPKQENALKRIEAHKKNFVGSEDISPLPCHSGTSGSNKRRNPRQGSSYIITSTPYKNELEVSMQEQERKKNLKGKGRKPKLSSELVESKKKKAVKNIKTTKTSKKQVKGKNNYCSDDDSSDSGSEPVLDDDSDMDVDDEDTEFSYQTISANIDHSTLPSFLTSSQVFKAKYRDRIVLPCEVANLGPHVIVWKRRNAVLSAGLVKITPDPRIQLSNGFNLEIKDVGLQDAGDYVCQIGTLEPREITHTLEILVPPQITYTSSNGQVEVKKGSAVILECKASGHPPPKITWSRKNNLLPGGDQTAVTSVLSLDRVDRHHGGIYQCTASNDVGMDATKQIVLHVLYPPEILIENPVVHSAEGFEAHLVCTVHGENQPEVLWYRDTMQLDTTERRIMESRGTRHSLVIRKVHRTDFGNYTCVADNQLGKTRKSIELTGKPKAPAFKSPIVGNCRETFNISWEVESLSQIEEYQLLFRRFLNGFSNSEDSLSQTLYHQGQKKIGQEENHTYSAVGYSVGSGYSRFSPTTDWRNVILPASRVLNNGIQSMSYVIRGLEPGHQYEAKVQARNKFGWSPVSKLFSFQTSYIDNAFADIQAYNENNEPSHVEDFFGITSASKASLCKSDLFLILLLFFSYYKHLY